MQQVERIAGFAQRYDRGEGEETSQRAAAGGKREDQAGEGWGQ
jgi:hypothetical protein